MGWCAVGSFIIIDFFPSYYIYDISGAGEGAEVGD